MDQLLMLQTIKKIQKNRFPKLRYSEENLEKIASILMKYKDESIENINKIIISYFKSVILKEISTNKYLQKVYFEPFKDVYEQVNAMFQISPNTTTLHIFIKSVVDLCASNQVVSLKKDILALYQMNLKELIKKENQIPILLNENKNLSNGQKYFYLNALQQLNKILTQKYSVTISPVPKENKETKTSPTSLKTNKKMTLFEKIKSDKKYETCEDETIKTALNILKESYPNYYDLIIKRHGENFNEWNRIKEQKEISMYTLAINKLKEIIQNPSKNYQESKTTLFEKIRSDEKYKTCKNEKIKTALNTLKESYPNYYNMIIKRHGENFTEWNKIKEQKDTCNYGNAIYKLKEIIQKSSKNESESKTTLFEKIRSDEKYKTCEDETIKTALNTLKESYPNYYNMIIKRHGENFTEWNKIKEQKDSCNYVNAIYKLKEIIQNPLKYDQESKTTTLFEKIRSDEKYKICEDEKIKTALNTLKESYPNYYNMIIKRHGENFTEWNKIKEPKDSCNYSYAIYKLKEIIQNPLKYDQKSKTTLFEKTKSDEKYEPCIYPMNILEDKELKQVLYFIESTEPKSSYSYKEVLENLKNTLEKIKKEKQEETIKQAKKHIFILDLLEDVNNISIQEISTKYSLSIKETCKIILKHIFYFENYSTIIENILKIKPTLKNELYYYLGSLSYPYLNQSNEKELQYWKLLWKKDINKVLKREKITD